MFPHLRRSTARSAACSAIRLASLPLIAFGLLLAAAPTLHAWAQTCAPAVLLSIARAGSACANLEPGQACFGGGEGGLILADGTAGDTLPGDRAVLAALGTVRVADAASSINAGSAEDAPISLASLNVALSPDEDDQVFLMLVNDASVTSTVAVPPQVAVIAIGLLPVRAAPEADAEVMAELAINAGADANGRTTDGAWLRVTLPTTGETGWVAASSVTVRGAVTDLQTAQVGDTTAQPFEVFTAEIAAEATGCGGLIASGILLQTPSTEVENRVALTINNQAIQASGTLFLSVSAGGQARRYSVLDGSAVIDGQIVPAGAAWDSGTLAPYDPALTAALPINNLPRRFQPAAPLAAGAVEAAIAAVNPPTPTPFVPLPTPEDQCRRTVGRDTLVWAGPGDNYEVLAELEAGTPITPVLAVETALDGTWWQLEDSGWIAQRFVVERGNCTEQAVPVTQRIPAPRTNTYSLERCESNNGPVRAGQFVTLEFVPPAWPSLAEATIATRTDPGRFSINAERYRASATEPIRLGTVNPLEDRYVRRFTYAWQAVPGTFRIIGDWLTYEPSCNLTVPVE